MQDPGARRAMWNFIVEATEAAARQLPAAGDAQQQSHNDLAVVLTTHNMEECEALCTRIGIMHQACPLHALIPPRLGLEICLHRTRCMIVACYNMRNKTHFAEMCPLQDLG